MRTLTCRCGTPVSFVPKNDFHKSVTQWSVGTALSSVVSSVGRCRVVPK